MADLGVRTQAPPGMDAVRERHAYYSKMARLAQIEMQKEESRVALQRLLDEESKLLLEVQDYEKANRKVI